MKNIVLVCQSIDIQSKNRRYDHTHINCMRTMLLRAGAEYDRLVVITNVDAKLIHPEFDVYPLNSHSMWKGWWSKMSIYDPALDLSGDILYLDLDVIPCAQINQLWHYEQHSVCMRRALHLESIASTQFYHHSIKDNTSSTHIYNSSVQRFSAGQLTELYAQYVDNPPNIKQCHRLDGDERYTSEFLANSNIPHTEFPKELLPYYPKLIETEHTLRTGSVPERSSIPYNDIAVLVFAGAFKPWSVAEVDQTIKELYPL